MKPLLPVFVDHGCELRGEGQLRALEPVGVDVLHDSGRLAGGGVLLLGARTSDGQASLSVLREIRRSNPHLIVYLCTPWRREVLADLPRYTRAGLDRLFTIGSGPDVADLVERVGERILAPPPESALRAVGELRLANRPLHVALHALRNSQCAAPLEVVAERFGLALRTVEGCVLSAGLPLLRDLYRCGRFLHGEELRHGGVRCAAERAARLGFDTATDMRKWRYRLRLAALSDERLRHFALLVPALDRLLLHQSGD